MSDHRFGRFEAATAAIAATVLAVTAAVPVHARLVAGCDVKSPRAETFLAQANATFPRLDSQRIARFGWHKAPRVVTLVTQPAKCDAIVAAHNAFVNGKHPAYHLTKAVIAQAGSSYLVEVPPGPGAAERMIFIYDSTLKFTAVY